MSATENTEPKVEETKPEVADEAKPAVATSSAVFSMFGGGAKKEKKDDEDRGDNSGSAKAQRDAAAENEVCHGTAAHPPLAPPYSPPTPRRPTSATSPGQETAAAQAPACCALLTCIRR